jgi:2-octaprenyl-3-methyl-6-methoxy-1,4-benzoquinol hydroxylase
VTSRHFDIAIIGSGIAGGALAVALKGSGLSVLLLDRRSGPLDTARGDHIQPAMQPVLSRWGVLDRLLEAGAERRAGTRWFDAEGAHVVTVPVPQRDDCAGAFLFLNHEKIGDILLDTAEEAGAVNITDLADWSLSRAVGSWRVDWQTVEQSGSATCTVLVAADGTASTVRSRLKMGLDRHRYQYPIAVLYGRQKDVCDKRTLDVYLAEERMVSLIPRTGGATKVGFPVSPEDIGFWKTGSEDALQRRLNEWCPGVSFESLAFGAIYPPVSQQSEPYQGEGALVLIGDARHAMHPARSMGMNTCFRVADQLADSLTCLKSGFSEAEVLPLLSEFETRFEQELTPRLAENHAAGLQMDTITGGGFAVLKEQLQLAAEDERILGAMALKAAGLTV